MKNIKILLLSFLVISCSSDRQTQFNPDLPVTAFINITLVPMDAERIQPNMTVLIQGDRIVRIGEAAAVQVPDDAIVIDGTRKFLSPGLAEMHGHVPPMESDNFPERYLDDVLFLYLAGGITTVRGMLGHENQLDIKTGIANGEMLVPNMYLAGPSFSGGSISDPGQAVSRVRQQVEEGWDLLKVHPGLTLEEFTAMAETANELGIDFAGHIPDDVGLENAIMLGIKTVDHLDGYIEFMGAETTPVTSEQLELAVAITVENDVWVVPTQALWETIIGAADPEVLVNYDELQYMPQNIVQGWNNFIDGGSRSRYNAGEHAQLRAENRQKLLKALQDGGAKILMGTDAPQLFSVPGLSIKRELAKMEDAGLTPYEILKSGTYNVGAYFSDKDDFGTITEGARADLVLLSENPLQNILTFADHEGVMIRGEWLSREMIDEKLEEIRLAYQE